MPDRLIDAASPLALPEAVERAAALARQRQSGDQASQVERFLRLFYYTAPVDDLSGRNAEELYATATCLMAFLRHRSPHTPRLRVFNPTVEEHGWQNGRTVVQAVNDDMPFLVDSLTAALTDLDQTIHLVIHPVVSLRRDETGTFLGFAEENEVQGAMESVIHVEIAEQHDPTVLAHLEHSLRTVLAEVRQAVMDWPLMLDQARAAASALDALGDGAEDAHEVRDFLTWMLDNHFTFLGYRNHSFSRKRRGALTVAADQGLGLLHDPDAVIFEELRDHSGLPPDVAAFLNRPTHLLITKSSQRARVHRPVHMDVIGIKRFSETGEVCGLHLFLGLFTSRVYTESPSFVPVLRRKLGRVIKRAGFRHASHDGKRLLNILETLPRDELFQSDDDTLLATALGILHLQERRRTALFTRRDEFERFVSCLVFVPKDRFDTSLRLTIQDILKTELQGEVASFSTLMGDSPLARLHLIVRTPAGRIPAFSPAQIEHRIAEAARSWADHLRETLIAIKGEEGAIRLSRVYGEGFPTFYRERFNAQQAVFDIDRMEEALDDGLAMNLYRPLEAGNREAYFKLYHPDTAIPLSHILPLLENMGFRLIGEVPYRIRLNGGDRVVWIHDFSMRTSDESSLDVGRVRQAFHTAFRKVWEGEAESDGFNHLVVRAGLSWRDVAVLRAYAKYLKQAGFTLSQQAVEAALAAHPDLTRLLVYLFQARFDPTGAGGNAAAFAERFAEGLEHVDNADEDRVLRRFFNLIDCTLRTNVYQKTPDGLPKPYMSFKIDSQRVEDLPLPRPMVETWVCSPRVEAVHLRGGKVARGGIRWSDRREDFRTEVLGLVKAQMVKNAVIVPVGSKGGFVVKCPPPPSEGREAMQAEGIACYRLFMRGLLDLTDTLQGETIVPPPDVVRHDGDDPYLVVAADKGTAAFSDIANALSLDYGFWLGDAFASGGSQGYDHKAMGITARGAWEAVKRHFRELGVDTQSQPFTVAGVGDMSGDVFGNGMLLSPHIRLVAAFNHQHIFLDPTPDAAASLAERERLFRLPRSAWTDYNPALISDGGGVFERSAKRLTLPEASRQMLGLSSGPHTPAEVIRAILSLEVDLLWFGGIGTYVRASEETDGMVGDRANDSVRITGRDLRARVVGEGANLAMTQRGRIEYALRGGRLNTDAIDNSAGVDCSDHEVNIKIALNRMVAEEDLTLKQRNTLLGEMTGEVSRLVLRHNTLQTQALSLMEAGGTDLFDHQMRLIRLLEKAGRLDRGLEFLPDEETAAERLAKGLGLTRPELSVLMAYSKLWLFDEILDSDLPDDPMMEEDLIHYFPVPLRERYRDSLIRHKLKREIIATHAANSIINRAGGTFVTQLKEKTGFPASDIARAYIIVRDAFGLRGIWREVETLGLTTPAATQTAMLLEANRLLERAALWVLRHAPRPLSMASLITAFRSGAEAMADCLNGVCSAEVREDILSRQQGFREAGVPEPLAEQVARLIVLASVPDLVTLSEDCAQPLAAVGRTYFAVGERFGLGWLRTLAEGLSHGNHWDKLAISGVMDDLYAHQRSMTASLLTTCPTASEDPTAALASWSLPRQATIDRADQLLGDLKAAKSADLSMLLVAARQFGMIR